MTKKSVLIYSNRSITPAYEKNFRILKPLSESMQSLENTTDSQSFHTILSVWNCPLSSPEARLEARCLLRLDLSLSMLNAQALGSPGLSSTFSRACPGQRCIGAGLVAQMSVDESFFDW